MLNYMKGYYPYYRIKVILKTCRWKQSTFIYVLRVKPKDKNDSKVFGIQTLDSTKLSQNNKLIRSDSKICYLTVAHMNIKQP